MVLQFTSRTVREGFVIMQYTQSPEETILYLILAALGILAVLLTFAYMIYGEEE